MIHIKGFITFIVSSILKSACVDGQVTNVIRVNPELGQRVRLLIGFYNNINRKAHFLFHTKSGVNRGIESWNESYIKHNKTSYTYLLKT